MLEQYLASPESVPAEWRALFESDDNGVLAALPGLGRLLERRSNGSAAAPAPAPAVPAAPAAVAPAAAPAAAEHDADLLGGVAAAMALVKAHRMHGHLA